MTYTQRRRETFEEELRKSISRDLFTNARVMNSNAIARNVDADVVNKCRLSMYAQESYKTNKLANRSGEEADMERLRDTHHGWNPDARCYALGDNIAVIYFNYYGHNFYGGDIVDNPRDGWTCPKCGLKYAMSLKSLPEYCNRCDHISPIGELIRDKALRT